MPNDNRKLYCNIFSVDETFFEKYKDENDKDKEKYRLVIPGFSMSVNEKVDNNISEESIKEIKETIPDNLWREKNKLEEEDIEILASGGIVCKEFVTKKREKKYKAYIKWNKDEKKIEQICLDNFIGTLSNSLDLKKMNQILSPDKKYKFDKSLRKVNIENCIGSTPIVINVDLSKDKKLREELYINGFNFVYDYKNKTEYHYVRYKRTASSARKGSCLFIVDTYKKGKKEIKVSEEMNKWSNCGLTEPKGADTKWEAYKSLSLSGILEKTITLGKNEILVVKDKKSIFKAPDDSILVCYDGIDYFAYSPKEKEEELKNAKEELQNAEEKVKEYETKIKIIENENTYKIENNIWDGESLIDNSVFMENEAYNDAHMLLLRARFLKTCAFRTHLQEWFKDNGINLEAKAKDVLNGFTLDDKAKVSDIKLVITESSLKYLKFANKDDKFEDSIRKWFKNAKNKKDSIEFGIVKTESKATGKVRTSYQFLQTIGLKDKEINDLISDCNKTYLEAYEKPKKFSEFLKNNEIPSFQDDEGVDQEYENNKDEDSGKDYYDTYVNEAIITLIKCAGVHNINGIPYYKSILDSKMKKYKKMIKKGHIPIEGIYGVLFGNPAEFLYSLIYDYDPNKNETLYYGKDKDKEIITIKPEHVYTNYYKSGEDILSIRFPHITMGNIFVPKNDRVESEKTFYDEYFELGDSIVCINSIGSTVLHRLNGADFDSDKMFMTNQRILLEAAIRVKDAEVEYKKKIVDEEGNIFGKRKAFPVPINKVDEIDKKKVDEIDKKKVDEINKLLSKCDNSICANKLGQIVNLASFMNGEFWNNHYINNNKVATGRESIEGYRAIWRDGDYKTLCILEVLSNLEVDRAKKNYPKSKIGCYKKEFMKDLRYRWDLNPLNLKERIKIIDIIGGVEELRSELEEHYMDYYRNNDESDGFVVDMVPYDYDEDYEDILRKRDEYRTECMLLVCNFIPDYYKNITGQKEKPIYLDCQESDRQYTIHINILLFWVVFIQGNINIETVVRYFILKSLYKIICEEEKDLLNSENNERKEIKDNINNKLKEINKKMDFLYEKKKYVKALNVLAKADYSEYLVYYCYSFRKMKEYIDMKPDNLEAEKAEKEQSEAERLNSELKGLIDNAKELIHKDIEIQTSLFINEYKFSVSVKPEIVNNVDHSFMGQLYRITAKNSKYNISDINCTDDKNKNIKEDLEKIMRDIKEIEKENKERTDELLKAINHRYGDIDDFGDDSEEKEQENFGDDSEEKEQENFGDDFEEKEQEKWESGLEKWKNRGTSEKEQFETIKSFSSLFSVLYPDLDEKNDEVIKQVKKEFQNNKLFERIEDKAKISDDIKSSTENNKHEQTEGAFEDDNAKLIESLNNISWWLKKFQDNENRKKAVFYSLKYIYEKQERLSERELSIITTSLLNNI